MSIIDWTKWRQYLKCVKHSLISKHKSYYIQKKTRFVFSFFIAIILVFFSSSFYYRLISIFNTTILLLICFFFSLSLRLCFAFYVHLHYHHSKNKPKYNNNSLWTKQNMFGFLYKKIIIHKKRKRWHCDGVRRKNNNLYLLHIWLIAILNNNVKITNIRSINLLVVDKNIDLSN